MPQETSVKVRRRGEDQTIVFIRHEDTDEILKHFVGTNIEIPGVGDVVTTEERTITGQFPDNTSRETQSSEGPYRVTDRVYTLVDYDINTKEYDSTAVTSEVEVYVLPSEEYGERYSEE